MKVENDQVIVINAPLTTIVLLIRLKGMNIGGSADLQMMNAITVGALGRFPLHKRVQRRHRAKI